MERFDVAHFSPDGELLESSALAISQLSRKWLATCSSLLDAGPVISRDMGSTLSHYHIECAAGLCYFRVHGKIAYAGALVSGSTAKDREVLRLFAERTGLPQALLSIEGRPLFLVLNMLVTSLAEEDREAMFQLAYHFAAAYFDRYGT